MKPLLSVVVPVHNVEEYLEDCLDSLAGQSLGAIEVVLVDDGSTDGSPGIARNRAARDDRFRYVHQPNAGLSAARNTGIARTTPGVPYLAFADSDDIVVHDAYRRMVASLESTGSDLVSGNVWRLNEQGRQQAWQYRGLNADRLRTHISRDPRLLADRVAWNKVFRRAFWDRHGFRFPAGRLYEDTPVMIPAHYLAQSVDVLREHVYYWRVREGSITRRRTDVKGVRDRIAACEEVSAFLADRDPVQRLRYDTSCLRDDFVYFLEGLAMGGPAYRTAFMTDAGAFLDRVGGAAIDGLPAELRVKWQLVRERRLGDLLAVLAFERANGAGTFTVRGLPGRRRAVFPGAGRSAGAGMSAGRSAGVGVRLGRADLPAVARLLEASWGEDGRLTLRGYAYIRNLPADRARHALKAGVLRADGGRRLRLVPLRGFPMPGATVDSGQESHCYDRSGFDMVLDPGKLRTGSWLVGVVVAGHGVVRRAALRAVDSASAQPLVHDLGDGRRAVLGYRDGRLRLSVDRVPALADAHDGGHGTLELTGRLYGGGARPTALLLTRDGGGAERSCPVVCGDDGERFAVRIPVGELAAVPPPAPHPAPREVERESGARWHALLLLAGGARVPLAAAPDLPPPATADASGELVLDLGGQPVVDRAERTADGGLSVKGTVGGEPGTGVLLLRHDTLRETVDVPVARQSGRFTARLAPPLDEGRWDLYLDGLPVRVRASLTARLPLPSGDFPAQELRLDRRHGDLLTLHAGPVLAVAERGAYRQRRLRTAHYPAQRGLPLRDAVLYTGGDSPRAVHAELVRRNTEVEHLWVVDGSTGRASHVPPFAVPVIEHSTAWYEALARARRIVTADQLPAWFERRPDQTVIQTWHGTPLGRFGTDLTGTLYADHEHLASLPHRAAQWSVLVSPSSFATPHLRRALAYGGEVLEAGSPANDVLFAPDRDKTAERVRLRLGVPEDHRVVLYAPTYRDHLAHTPGRPIGTRAADGIRYRWEPALDLPGLARSLDAHTTVLVRRHPRVTGSVPGGPAVRDVSGYPDTAELLLIADVLITDYSGLVFDFAHTGRPMLFHTYDLEHYRDTVRGFCLDFETRAPGPLLISTDEVAGALREADAAGGRHREACAGFRRDHCDLDDGGAARRVADRLLADD